ncbi:MAG: aryl-sulfate sulfotransferase [Planctomycetota bacterium]|nr:aryl-sulfate sulfotransferase [Planctomycetota bacterium]
MTRTLIIWAMLATSALAYERLQGPTELLYCNQEKSCHGYTLFGVGSRTYLLDLEGRVVHTWPIGTNPHLLDNGNILDASKDDPSGFQGFQEVDWDGKTVWEYTENREDYAPHHDWVRIFNKKLNAPSTLYIANKSITNDQALAAGADPQKAPYRDGQMDAVVEVDRQGHVIWEWWFFDHVVQEVDPTKANFVGPGKTVADHPGRININLPGRPLKRDWLHCNSMDYNAESGHIAINSVQGELYVIDHDGTFVPGDPQASIAKAAGPAGDFLYRFGDPARYAQGAPPRVLENWDSATSGHKQMGGAHDVHWIRPGLPGAGHLMVFNNGQYLYQRTPQSSVLEINPFLDASGRDTGKYVNPPAAGYRRETYDHDTHNQPRQISKQIVWSYRSVNSHGFFSHIGSSAQRLPNGNTFICSDTEGHFFEVTAEGELVWEYINPVTRDGAVKVLGDVLPMTNSAFRAYRYVAEHPAFQDRDLAPKGTITERAAQGLDVKRRPPGDRRPADRPQGNGDGEKRRGKGGQGGGRGKGDAAAQDDRARMEAGRGPQRNADTGGPRLP